MLANTSRKKKNTVSIVQLQSPTMGNRGRRPGAIRMARLRERRQRGYRVFQIEVCDRDIASLIARGLLDRLRRDDPDAVERALGALLDRIAT